jgi:hypothetical protein
MPHYAVVAAVSGQQAGFGLVFMTLTTDGMPCTRAFYEFPMFFGSATQPYICESSTPGTYYICGNYFDSWTGEYMYVLSVDMNGTILWSNIYQSGHKLQPRGIMESPYNANELVLIGRNDPDASQPPGLIRLNDGFFLKLRSNNGAVLTYKVYGHTSSGQYAKCNDFFCFAPAFSTWGGSAGYVIGGNTEPLASAPGIERSWMLKVDTDGNIIWNTIINSSTGQHTGITDVFERRSTITGNYEYFGTTCSMNGEWIVYKLDDSGMLMSGNNEFIYSPANPGFFPVYMTNRNNGNSDDGLQLYGTEGMTPSENYFVKAYYSGHSATGGCSEMLTTAAVQGVGPTDIIQPLITMAPGLTQYTCGNFAIAATYVPVAPVNINCSASAIGGASNARLAAQDEGTSAAHVFPNPSSGNVTVTYPAQENVPATIEIFNATGQKISTMTGMPAVSGMQRQELDLGAMHLETGIYFIRIVCGEMTYEEKVIYERIE